MTSALAPSTHTPLTQRSLNKEQHSKGGSALSNPKVLPFPNKRVARDFQIRQFARWSRANYPTAFAQAQAFGVDEQTAVFWRNAVHAAGGVPVMQAGISYANFVLDAYHREVAS